MLSYPVHFPRERYRGGKENLRRKAAEINRLIQQVEQYVNEQGKLNQSPFHQYVYSAIALKLGLDPSEVRHHCMIDGGHNGFTVIRPGLTMDEAFAEAEATAGGQVAP
ncbi:hypothetical protein ACFWZ1_14980 [Frateuria sp. GZRe14]|uniref:hypothetical protein n=1 Tax=Frateuria sp. GZRe14 TaxID=3351534 RepID=UPI003EDC77EF